jgi:aryl-alcohol dehydrogenase-like predicted oxidoreductase
LPRAARKTNRTLVESLVGIGARKGATPAQIALAWLLARKPWIVPIPGTRRMERLDENLGSLVVKLTADDLREIEAMSSAFKVQGDRYPEDVMKLSGL